MRCRRPIFHSLFKAKQYNMFLQHYQSVLIEIRQNKNKERHLVMRMMIQKDIPVVSSIVTTYNKHNVKRKNAFLGAHQRKHKIIMNKILG